MDGIAEELHQEAVDRSVRRQAFTVRLDPERYEWMRRQAFERRISLQRLIDEAIDLIMGDGTGGSEQVMTAPAPARKKTG